MYRGLTFGWQSPIIHCGEVWCVRNLRKIQALNICNEYISTDRLFKYSIIDIYLKHGRKDKIHAFTLKHKYLFGILVIQNGKKEYISLTSMNHK